MPVAGPYEAVLEPVALCPCTSDINTAAENKNATPGRILGHEGVGRIVSVGSEVKDFVPGDIVAVPAVTPVWRNLDIQDGVHQHSGGPLGGRYLSSKWDGMFGEYFKVPDVDLNVAKIPEGVSLEAAALVGDMVTTGFHGVELAEVEFGGRRRLECLMDIVKSGRLPVEKLISHKFYGFDAIEDAFNLMAGKTPDIVKPIVYMDK